MQYFEIKKLPIMLAILGIFSLEASAQEITIVLDWSQNEDFRDW